MRKHGSNKAGRQKAQALTTDASGQHTQTPTSLSSAIDPSLPLSISTPLQHSIDSQPKPAPKVAIPRLRRGSEDQSVFKISTAADKHRVTHACEPCRHRKTKCSGERPACQHCQDFRLSCIYADGKRERTRKQLDNLAGRVEEYERLLEDLWSRVGDDDQNMIRTALDKEAYSEDDDMQSILSPRRASIYREPAGEHKVSARVGSTESLDQIDEDFNRNVAARATGFHGKNSDITWMQRLKRASTADSDEYALDPGVDDQKSPASETHHPSSGKAPTINESSYHCDDLNVLISGQIDPYEVPAQAIADMLFKSYLDTVHPAFPIVSKQTFSDQYQVFSASQDKRKINQNWLAILNLIFAIGAKYSHLIQAERRGDPGDHLIYFTRARLLGFNADHILGHAELQRVQITGLMTFYLMAINQINRSWVVSGIAIRHASTLGLNLRNASKDVAEASREIRYRVWWALCSVERRLAVMTGRPTSFAESDCTAPSPLPLEEDSLYSTASSSPEIIRMFRRMSSNESLQHDKAMPSPSSSSQSSKVKGSPVSSIPLMSPTLQSSQQFNQTIPPSNALAFSFSTKLSTFTNEVLKHLYRADAMDQSWAQVQGTIANLNSKLEKLQSELPPIFDFSKKQRDLHFMPQRLGLGFFYYSTSMIINRPCLCRIDRKIPNESGKARDFNRETAARCVHAARDMLGLLPDEPNPVGLYKVAPWWCLVHYLMQAATVMMLEMSFRADHMPTEVEEVFGCAKKALEWLRSMADDDEAARRASVLCGDLLRKVAPKIGRNPNEASDLESHRPQKMENMQVMQGGMPDGHIDPGEPAQHPSQYAYTTSAPFQPQMFTSYDQFLSYGSLPTTSGAPFEDMFPTANDMENMNFEDPGYYQGSDQRWFPGSSA